MSPDATHHNADSPRSGAVRLTVAPTIDSCIPNRTDGSLQHIDTLELIEAPCSPDKSGQAMRSVAVQPIVCLSTVTKASGAIKGGNV